MKAVVRIIKKQKLFQKFSKKLDPTSYFSNIYGTGLSAILASILTGMSGRNPRLTKLSPQVSNASSNSTEYEMLRNLIFVKIFPATEAEIPVGLPEDKAAVACVTALEAVPVEPVTSIVVLTVSEVFTGRHRL